MKFIGTISNPEDVITKGWITKNIADVIPDGSITADKLADGAGGSSDFRAVEVYNPALTKADNTFTWNIEASEHKMLTSAVSIVVYDANGKLISCDVGIDSSLKITISIYDASSATTVAEKTYKAVIIGLKTPTTDDVSTLITTELDKKQLRTDLLTLEESENPNTDNMVIPFYDTITENHKKVALNSILGNNSVNASDIQGEISGTQIADKAINISHLESNFILPVEDGGTGAQDAATARTNLEITPANIGAIATTAGAIGTTNLADGAITRVKLASDVLGSCPQDWGSSYFPFVDTNNGKVLAIWTQDRTITHAITSDIFTALPQGYTLTIIRTGAGEDTPFIIAWDGVSVINGSTRAWDNTGSITMKKQGDMVKFIKQDSLFLLQTNIIKTFYSGTSTPSSSLGNDGDVYFKYTT